MSSATGATESPMRWNIGSASHALMSLVQVQVMGNLSWHANPPMTLFQRHQAAPCRQQQCIILGVHAHRYVPCTLQNLDYALVRCLAAYGS